jgi:hypothetical protein
VEIANKTGAVLVCNPELAGNLVKLANFPVGKQKLTTSWELAARFKLRMAK